MKIAGEIGLTHQEIEKFSVARLLRALIEPLWGAAHAGFELAASAAVRGVVTTATPGHFIPGDVMGRALTTGSVGAGGALVQTTVSEEYWAPALRAASKVRMLGATGVSSSDSVALARLRPGGQAAGVTENSASTENDPTFELSTFSPKTIRNHIVASRRLLTVTGTIAETVIRRDLADAVGEIVDKYAIQGSGAGGQPTGVISTAGISVIALGTNGAAPTYAPLIDCVRQVGLKNAVKGKPGWIGSTKAACTMRNVTKTASWGFLWDDPDLDDDIQYDGAVLGYPAFMSENVPSTLVKGTSGATCSALIFGDWSELFIIEFSPIAILPDPYSLSSTGAVRFNVYQEVDIQPRRVDSFAAILDMIAT